MFDGVPAEQLHQFIAAAAASRSSLHPLPHLPLSASTTSFPALPAAIPSPFDPYNNPSSPHPHHQLLQLQPHQQHHHQVLHHHQLHRQSLVLPATHRNEEEKHDHHQISTTLQHQVSSSSNLETEREQRSSSPSISQLPNHPWTNDELLALLRIRSTMENWFPDFIWEHVSRKLAELGFKRSAEKCKEKFEEESRYFSNNINFNKSYCRYDHDQFEDQLYQAHHDHHVDDHHQNPDQAPAGAEKLINQKVVEKPSDHQGVDHKRCQILLEHHEDSTRNDNIQTLGNNIKDLDQNNEKEVKERTNKSNKKRKRQKRFKMLKVFCEDVVNKMMAQQEEMHSKLLEDMVRRDEEKLAREEAWKKQEMDRMNKELEIMTHEQALSGDRQTTIINFLKKFTSSSNGQKDHSLKVIKKTTTTTTSDPSPHSNSSSQIQAQNPNPTCDANDHQNHEPDQEPTSSTMVPAAGNNIIQNNPTTPTSLTETLAPQSPSSSTLAPSPSNIIPKVPISSPPPENPSSDLNTQNPTSTNGHKVVQDLGKRWPRDEVLALINLRCSLLNNGDHQDKDEGVVKAPLWERISQGMLEMGYKRSAKRCKEKWENINKYFRKTKDVNKKRSLDSRTCPYFHQLSTLYNQGILVPPSDHHQGLENRSASPENHSPANSVVPKTCLDSSSQGRSCTADVPSSMHNIGEGERNSTMVQVAAAAFDFEF